MAVTQEPALIQLHWPIYSTSNSTDYSWWMARHDLTLSPCKAEKPALPTVTNSHEAEILAFRSLIYSRKDEISAWKFRGKLLQIMLVSGSSGSGDPMLWELRGERVNTLRDVGIKHYCADYNKIVVSSNHTTAYCYLQNVTQNSPLYNGNNN